MCSAYETARLKHSLRLRGLKNRRQIKKPPSLRLRGLINKPKAEQETAQPTAARFKKYFGFTFDQFIELVSVVYTAENCLVIDTTICGTAGQGLK